MPFVSKLNYWMFPDYKIGSYHFPLAIKLYISIDL